MRTKHRVIWVIGLLLVAGCRKQSDAQFQSAVRKAVEDHLQARQHLALSKMTITIEEVKVNGGNAAAKVRFGSRQSSDVSVEVAYVLRRSGDRWQVQSSTPLSGMMPKQFEGHPPPPDIAPTTDVQPQSSH